MTTTSNTTTPVAKKVWRIGEVGQYVSECRKFVIKDEGTKFGLYRMTSVGGTILITRCANVDLLLRIADKCE